MVKLELARERIQELLRFYDAADFALTVVALDASDLDGSALGAVDDALGLSQRAQATVEALQAALDADSTPC